MRKCRVKFSNSNVYFDLSIDEEKNICMFNKQNKELDINNLLNQIERIIANWKPAQKTKGLVLDGSKLEIHYLNNFDELLQFKYSDLTFPNNAHQLYSLLEQLNGK